MAFNINNIDSLIEPLGSPFDLLQSERIGNDIKVSLPTQLLEIRFRGNRFLKAGELIKPLKLTNSPHIKYEADPDSFTTVIMVDLDVPNRYECLERERLQWLVVNIPGSEVSRGKLVAEYMPPIPCRQSNSWDGRHRICCYVFIQKTQIACKINFIKRNIMEGRARFSMYDFQKQYDLDDPTYGTMFFSEFDSHVPMLIARLEDSPEKHKF